MEKLIEMDIALSLLKFISIIKELQKFLLHLQKERKIMTKEKVKKIEIGTEKKLESLEKQVDLE